MTTPPPHEPTNREELGALTRLATPIVLAQLAFNSMGLVDVAVVGHTSVQNLAGVALGRTLGFVSMTIGMGVAMALEPLAAQALGAGEPVRAWRSFVQTVRALGLVWAVSATVSFASSYLLVPVGVDVEVADKARLFLAAELPGLALFLVFLAAKTYLQAHGKTRPAVIAAVLANVLNFLFCNVLVRGDAALVAVHLPAVGLPAFGALGAGMAFSLAMITMVGITLYAARAIRPVSASSDANANANANAEQMDKATSAGKPVGAADVLRLGLPIGAQIFAEAGAFSLVAILAGRLGDRVVSAHQIALALASTTYMASVGVSGATAVRVGLAVGEGRSPARAGYLGVLLGAIWMSCGAALFAFAPTLLISLFTIDPEVASLGVVLLRIAAVFQLFDGVQTVGTGALRGAGDVRAPFLIATGAHWLLGIPLSMLLGFGLHMGAAGLWWGLTGSLVAVSVLFMLRFRFLVSRPIARI